MTGVQTCALPIYASELLSLYAGGSPGDLQSYPFEAANFCNFSGYVFDEADSGLDDANITIWNQDDISENYETQSDSNGYWTINLTNSTNKYMVGAYFNDSLIGQLKPFISGTC